MTKKKTRGRGELKAGHGRTHGTSRSDAPVSNVCLRCGYDYPEHVSLNPVIGSMVTVDVCGICALEIVNAVHGTRMKQFHGEMAEHYRLDAIEARRNGSARKPVEVT